MEASYFDKLNGFWTGLGIKPAVANTFITGLIAIVAFWVIDGGSFDTEELRLLVGNFLLALAGIASPPSVGTVMTKQGPKARDERAEYVQ